MSSDILNERQSAVGSTCLLGRARKTPSVSGPPAIPPLVRPLLLPQNVAHPKKDESNPVAVVDSDDEGLGCDEKRETANPTSNMPSTSGAERAQAFMDKKKVRLSERKALFGEKDRLFSCPRRRCYGKNQYDDSDLSLMLRVGTCPSAGGSRAPLSSVISR